MRDAPSVDFGRALFALGVTVTVLFSVLDPSPSNGLDWPARFGFWALHAFGGLGALALAQGWVDRLPALRRRPWIAVVVGGLVGALVFAPLAVVFEGFFDLPVDDPEDLADAASRSWWLNASIEAGELAPSLVVTWVVIQLPWLLQLDFRSVDAEPAEPEDEAVESPGEPWTDGLFAELPEALGRDIVSLGSELHYLRVRTTRGQALVLYNLRDAVAELDGRVDGLSIHRSHWVARDHVRQLVRQGSGWACELSTGDLVPISRRKARAVRATFGDAARYGATAGD